MSTTDVDAEKLRQIVNLYAGNGYVAQVRNFGETDEEIRVWGIDRSGTQVPHLWSNLEEVEALRRLGILEPEEWETNEEEAIVIRKYRLTDFGFKFANKSNREQLAYFAAAGFKPNRHRYATWEQEELE